MTRKGQKELTMIISLIILLVVAVVTISLFLQFFGQEPDIGKKQIERQKAITQCKSLCEQIKTGSNEELESNIWDYCTQTFNLQKSGGLGDVVVSGVAGADSYCRSQAHCFDLHTCTTGGTTVEYETCRVLMCKGLTEQGMSKKEAAQEIKKVMWEPVRDACALEQGESGTDVKGTSQEIRVTPNYKESFQNPTCQGTGGGDDDGGGACTEFCKNTNKGNFSGATKGTCVTFKKCSTSHAFGGQDGAPCTGLNACCCKK